MAEGAEAEEEGEGAGERTSSQSRRERVFLSREGDVRGSSQIFRPSTRAVAASFHFICRHKGTDTNTTIARDEHDYDEDEAADHCSARKVTPAAAPVQSF